jgi:hypothetical protein
MNLYLDEENPDLNSIYCLISDTDQMEMKDVANGESNELYTFYYEMFLNSCLRQGKQRFNLFLLLRAEDNRK